MAIVSQGTQLRKLYAIQSILTSRGKKRTFAREVHDGRVCLSCALTNPSGTDLCGTGEIDGWPIKLVGKRENFDAL